MQAGDIPRSEWKHFLEDFNRVYKGHVVSVTRHQPGAGIVFEVENCIFERALEDSSGDWHRIGVIVGEPRKNQETFFMTNPRQVVWTSTDTGVDGSLTIDGSDGRSLVVRILQNEKAAA